MRVSGALRNGLKNIQFEKKENQNILLMKEHVILQSVYTPHAYIEGEEGREFDRYRYRIFENPF